MSSCYFTAVLILTLFSPISTIAHISRCSEAFELEALERNIPNCKKLNSLGAEFGWSYHNDSLVDIYIGARVQSEAGWLAWGVNPQGAARMVGTRALIGIKQPNGSLVIKTYNITWETRLGCRLHPSEIDVEIRHTKFEYFSEMKFYTIYATLVLPSAYNITRLNHVWQVGYAANGIEPLKHRKTLQNVDSTETIDLKSSWSHGIGAHRHHLRTVHGILDMVGWGTFLPVGVIIARYCRRFPFHCQYWFRLHVSCQIIGYTLGTTGWAIGLWLGRASKYHSFPIHGLLATFIFTFTTLQMLALRLKPNLNDDYRKYWSMYHHFLGYALLVLIIMNIFRGIGIFTPNHTWKWVYIGVLCVLASIILALEILTWIKFKNSRENKQENKTPLSSTQQAKESATSN